MALPQPKQFFNILFIVLCLVSCKHTQKVYKSDCDIGKPFKHIGFKQLMDSLADYDQQYVEVSGKYMEDKELSALFCDSLLADGSASNALWVNFSQDCPLYLSGTRQGLFEYTDAGFTRLNKQVITIRGRIDVKNKGSHHNYKATIDRVSFIKM